MRCRLFPCVKGKAALIETESIATALHVQCPVCARRFDVSRYRPGSLAKCPCGYRLKIPIASEAIRLPALDNNGAVQRSVRPLLRSPSPSVVREPAPPLIPPSPPPLIPSAPPRHPVIAAVLANQTVELDLVLLRLLAEQLALEGGFDVLRSLAFLRGLRLHDYQERTARHVLKRLGGRALLADEVGLGKTIEATCILSELHLRGLIKKVLILTPATLVTQWKAELAEKFRLDFHIGRDAEDWSSYDLLIASLDTAKTDRHAAQIQQVQWGLVIVDEAHRLKNRTTRNWKFVNGIRARYLLLLSATPFQNDLIELYNLVTLLRPGQLYTDREFKEKFLTRGDRRKCKDPQALKELLAQVMVRNRRGEVGVQFVARHSTTRRLEMPPEQAALYEAAIDFCRDWFDELYGMSAPLVTIGYLKMLCGSPYRFRESLVRKLLPRARELKQPQLESAARKLVKLADAVPLDVKLEALVQDVMSHEDKVVVFTQYRGTLAYLATRLKSEQASCVQFHGGMNAKEKDAAIEQFRGPARVLLATDAGSEGRNLQFAHRLANYDLPWNPMRVEQRIGRVHRMGQTRDVIVTSYTLSGTLEDQLLELLERKLNLFRLVVGEVEMILGKLQMEQQVAKMFLQSRNNSDFQQRLAHFGEELAALKSDYDHHQTANHEALPRIEPAP
jgi:SNF2 family DNA or RNA helicase